MNKFIVLFVSLIVMVFSSALVFAVPEGVTPTTKADEPDKWSGTPVRSDELSMFDVDLENKSGGSAGGTGGTNGAGGSSGTGGSGSADGVSSARVKNANGIIYYFRN